VRKPLKTCAMKAFLPHSITLKSTRICWIVVLLISFPLISSATSYTWIGGVSNEWGNPANWSPSSGTPDIGDDVTIQTGSFSPLYEEISGLNNFTINSGTLNLAGFTMPISGAANFNGGIISNGGVHCTGAVIFGGTVFNAAITGSSSSISFNGSTFNNPVSITKTGAGSVTSTGGNSFESTFSLSNTGSGEIILGNTGADAFKDDATFTNSGTGWISVAHAASGNTFSGNIIVNSSGSSPGVRFGQSGGSSSLASGKTLQVGTVFSIGDLYLKNFTQNGSTAQSLTLTGTAALVLESGSTFNGSVSFTSPQLFLNGVTFVSTADFVKNGAGNNQSLGGNTFSAVTTISNTGAGELLLGVSSPDIFQADLTLSNTGTQTLYVAHGSTGNQFNDDIIVNSTGSSKGVRFGQNGGTSTLATGKTITVGGSGFTAGSLRLRNVTQSGSTPQSIVLASGTAALYLESGTVFNANVNFEFPQLFLNGTTFNGTATLVKNGATSNTSTGGNTFGGTTVITNSGSANLILGSTNADVFNAALELNATGSAALQLSHGGTGHQFNQDVTLNSTGSSQGIRFGQNGGTSTLASGKVLLIGASGFDAGELRLKGFTQTGSTAQSLIDFGGTVAFYLETGTTFNGASTFTAPQLYLNGSTFNQSATLTLSGSGSVGCLGGNTFNSTVSLVKTGDAEWILGGSSADVFANTLTIENTSGDVIYLADGGSGHEFNGNVLLNCTGTASGIRFGQNGGTSTLASTKQLQLGSGGFNSGDLRIAGLTQSGSTTQSLTGFGSGVEVYLQTANTFNGNVTLTAPGVYLDGTTFNANANITKTGSTPNISAGGNVFNGTTTVTVTGSGAMYMAGSAGDDFNGDVSFLQTTAFTLYPAYNSNTTFSANVSTEGSSTAVHFAASAGTAIMDGGANQSIVGDAILPPVFGKLSINKSANRVTLLVPISVSGSLTLVNGRIISTSSNLLTMLDNATVSGASDASHVSGPVLKEGNDAFVFPIGKSGIYRPISITAPSSTAAQFQGTFFFADSDGSYAHSSKDGSIDHLSHCEYWTLDRIASTSSVSVTLSWNTTSCGVTNLGDLRVCRWNGSMWKDHGNGGTSGNTTTGSITSSAAITSFSPFTLGSSSSENPLPVNLLHFAASPQNQDVVLDWATLSETNNAYFVVESSSDAQNFEEVLRVSGAGNSNTLLNYSTIDQHPYPGVSYYRLKQVDYDGKVMYSGVRVVNMPTLWETEVVLTPNPVETLVQVRLDPKAFSMPQLELRDIQGRLVQQYGNVAVDPQKPVELNLEALKPGLYFIQVNEGTRTAVQRLIKK
jgi:hypothetical protein